MVVQGLKAGRIQPVFVAVLIGFTLGQVLTAAQAADSGKTLAREVAALHELDALSVSPDGRWGIVQERAPDVDYNKTHVLWKLIDLTHDPAVKYVFDGGEPLVRRNAIPVGALFALEPIWSHDGRWFLLAKKNREKTQLMRGRPTRPSLEKLTDVIGEVTSYQVSNDDENILLEVKKTSAQIADALAEERQTGFLFDQRFVPSVSTSPLMSHVPLRSRHEGLWKPAKTKFVLSLKTGELNIASREEEIHFESGEFVLSRTSGFFSPDGQRMSNVVSGTGVAWKEAQQVKYAGVRAPHILVAMLEKPDRMVCRHVECSGDLDVISWTDPHEILFSKHIIDVEERTSIYMWNTTANTIKHISTAKGILDDCEARQHDLICFSESAKAPRRLVSLNLDSGDIEAVFNPNPTFPELNDIDIVRIPIKINGVPVTSAILAHRSGKPGPLIITTYSCNGLLKGSTGDEYPILPLVAEGFSVMCLTLPAMRGFGAQSTSSGAEVSAAMGPGLPYYRLSHDALAEAVRKIGELGLADVKKRAITGLSNGASFAIYEIERGPYAAAITSSGTYSPLMRMLGGAYTNELFDYWGMDERFMNDIRPDPAKIETPLLINVSDQELLNSLPIYNDLQAHHGAVEMYVHANEGHVKNQPKHRLAIYNRNIQWLKFWLQDKEVEEPVDPDQYARWRAMRDEQCSRLKGSDAPGYCHG